MKRRFLALRIVSIIFKILGVLAFILMIGGIAWVLLDANTFGTMDKKLPTIGVVFGIGLILTILFFAVGQMIDLQMALEINTRATTAMIQQLGKVMKERL